VKKMGDGSQDGGISPCLPAGRQKCRTRAFSEIVLNGSKLFILNALCIFVNKTEKGYRSTFFLHPPHPGFENEFFRNLGVVVAKGEREKWINSSTQNQWW
jgi:hypothetical protein